MGSEAGSGRAGEQASATDALRDSVFLAELRVQMVRFASLQLSDAQLAEDAVQEALIGAMTNAGKFAGRAAFKTWVFAILKNKIADVLRQRSRLVEASQLAGDDEDKDVLEMLFERNGHWRRDERPRGWDDPEGAIENAQFWRVFETCLSHLPGRQGQVFMMREFVELDTAEICAALGLSVGNVNVILHRARLRLRECLENHWFLREAPC
ncbi:RNA polymerase factor sigma-70 [Thermomonas sp. S9]|nr:RNA polymerase factor sigma-70 [Thermomonas sp. S9]